MAVFGSTSYTKPGVYTQVVIETAGQPLFGAARIPVIIGEGTQFFTKSNVELFRGSSSNTDDQAVNENISNQVTGTGRAFQATYFPITDGSGKGVVTNDPSKMQVLSVDAAGNQIPVAVISLNGATGGFSTQTIIPATTQLFLTYSFKRGDTQVVNEDLHAQIPSFATLTIVASVGNSVTLSTSNPGALGNLVTLALTDPGSGSGVSDAQAVLGAGTDVISIVIRKADNSFRQLHDLTNLVAAGIPTLDAGELTVASTLGSQATPLIVASAAAFVGGNGPSTNTTFQTHFGPITDGTNGGVVSTTLADVQVLVNGLPATVTALNGQQSQFTLKNPVVYGSTLTVTYFFNTWQNTFDLLPASNVQDIVEVGLGPNRSDYVENVDFSLGIDAAGNGTIVWGPAVSEAVGVSAAGEAANFTPAEVVTSVVDEQVFLVKLTGSVNGKNYVFATPDSPTDGTGTGTITDSPTLIQVYVGTDPVLALAAGAVPVARLNGSGQVVTLFNPPAAGNVYATYYRNALATHQYSLKVITPGLGGLGTFIIQDELGRVAPAVALTGGVVAAGGYATTGVVYPFSKSDAQAATGAALDEVITLTFNNDGTAITTPATQARVTLTEGASGYVLTAVTPGTGGNAVTVAVDNTAFSAPSVVGNAITLHTLGNTVTAYSAAFPSISTTWGAITVTHTGSGSDNFTTAGAVSLAGGAAAISSPFTHSYAVTSSLGALGSVGTGYLDETYIDAKTGFRVTIVNPADHVAFGVASIPSNYSFAPADTLVYTVKADAAGANQALRHCGTPGTAPAEANNLVAIPGLLTTVISNFQSTAGDTVVVSTFRGNGNSPNIGEFYYTTFTTGKTSADYALKVYTNPADAYTAYGTPSSVNRLSLGIQFLTNNGTQTFAAIQVPVIPGTNQAADADFIAAIQSLAMALPGSDDQYVSGVVPLSTSPSVHQSLSRFLTTQATPRIQAFGIGIVGYDQFTNSNQARQNALALNSERMIAIGNPVAGVLVTDSLTGVSVEYPVSGEFMAAGLAGLEFNPANDVATTLTNQNITGFSRLLKIFDNPTMDMMAADGLTLLVSNQGALRVRHYKTTRPENAVYSEPTCTTSVDYTRETFESDMKQFIGRKLVSSLVSDVTVVANSRLASLVNQQILSGYRGLTVAPDASNPTLVNVSVDIKPMFSLLYIAVTFSVTTTL